MIQKIVNDILNEKELMEDIESITPIDDETILFTGFYFSPGIIKKIIQDNGYRIKDEENFTILNGETLTDREVMSQIRKYINNNMPKDIGWRETHDMERKLWDEFHKKNHIIENIHIIKIKPYHINIEKMYQEWKEEHKDDMTVGRLIKELTKLDPNTLIFAIDNEYGEYLIHSIADGGTYTSCPDCRSCGCVECDTRKMFRRKCIVLR